MALDKLNKKEKRKEKRESTKYGKRPALPETASSPSKEMV